MSVDAALRVDGLRLSRGGSVVLDGVDLMLAGGEWLTVCGPNGAGKSTLISCIAGDALPDRGLVRLHGEDVMRIGDARQSDHRAVLVQTPSLTAPFPAQAVVAMGDAGASAATCVAGLDELGIAHLAARSYPTLSGGERRLVQLARVLLQTDRISARHRDAVLLLDEPTAHLDPVMAARVLQALGRRVGAGVALLMATHELELASRHAQRMLLLRAGAVVCDRATAEVCEDDLQCCFGAPVRMHRTGPGAGMRIAFTDL